MNEPRPLQRRPAGHDEAMRQHHAEMHAMHLRMLWVHFTVIALGAWLLTSPFQFALFDAAAVQELRNVTAERGLWDPTLRNALTGWNDIACGVLLIVFGALSLSERFKWAQWAVTVVGLWLLFAPLVFWTPSAAAYANDTAVGSLAIVLSILVPMMPGMSHAGMMDKRTIPAGWSYNPSTWLQRLPIITLGFFGFLLARYLAAYQYGHIDSVWEPFFGGTREGLNGSEDIITSYVSQAFPVPDAALGAYAYMLESLMGAMGGAQRWRTMPWMVTFFFILVVPLGAVSIGFIIIQPIMIGTYCTLCLIQAFAMLIMIPLAIDEVVAMGQYLRRAVANGAPLWRTFFQGGPDEAARHDEHPEFDAPLREQVSAAVRGVTFPMPLLLSCLVGGWLMFSRLVFGTEGLLAHSDHLVGAMIITVAVIAMAEVARPLRFTNVLLGLWLAAAPWLLAEGLSSPGALNGIGAGIIVAALSVPRGARSRHHYGAWDAYVF